MPICKLCKQERELRESHFLPAAVYAQLRDDAAKNANPVVITTEIAQTTSRQIKDYVLCPECEDRFSKYGETWVMANMARREGFGLQRALLARKPMGANEHFAYYSSLGDPPIDMDALVYFGMSVFWRAAAHTWRNASGQLNGIDLGPFEEPIRRFLLGDTFPDNTVVLITVWPTKIVLPAAYTPKRGSAPDCHIFNFLVPGIEFKLFAGRRIPNEFRMMCSHRSSEKLIYSATAIVTDTVHAFENLVRTSRPSRALRERTRL
jgi:hypothetical protein